MQDQHFMGAFCRAVLTFIVINWSMNRCVCNAHSGCMGSTYRIMGMIPVCKAHEHLRFCLDSTGDPVVAVLFWAARIDGAACRVVLL